MTPSEAKEKFRVLLAAPPWRGMENPYPPLGLGYLAAAARTAPGLEVEPSILDFGLHPGITPAAAARRVVAGGPPHVLGLTCMTHTYPAALELAEAVKAWAPGVRVILGGPHPSVDPAAAAARGPVDAVVYGEGERTFVELLGRFREGAGAEGVPGSAFRGPDGEVMVNPPRPLVEDLDTLPFPARDLLDPTRYRLRAEDGRPVFTLFSSRGCPYDCTYCYKGVFGRRFRARSAYSVVEEVKHLVRTYDAHHLYFADDIFMVPPDRVRAICEGFLREGLRLSWSCLARVDAVSPELLTLMKRAGCAWIHYGIESGVPEILERIRKRTDLEAVTRAVRLTREAGIRSKGYFMAGLPGDTEETLARTLRFARRLPLDEVMFSLATPFPGTALWAACKHREGFPGEEAFERAYYFDDGAGAVQVFYNVSDVDTEKLEAFVHRAQAFFRYRAERNRFRRRFGPLLAPLAHAVYRLRERGRG